LLLLYKEGNCAKRYKGDSEGLICQRGNVSFHANFMILTVLFFMEKYNLSNRRAWRFLIVCAEPWLFRLAMPSVEYPALPAILLGVVSAQAALCFVSGNKL
jgi:hypothetical protein